MNYLSAVDGERRVDVYGYDLIWKLVDMQLQEGVPMPSEMWKDKINVDRRTGEEIINDLIKGLDELAGGE